MQGRAEDALCWAAYHRAVPLGRSARPEEVAGVIRFLLSDEAAYMTGQSVAANGGAIMVP